MENGPTAVTESLNCSMATALSRLDVHECISSLQLPIPSSRTLELSVPPVGSIKHPPLLKKVTLTCSQQNLRDSPRDYCCKDKVVILRGNKCTVLA